MQAGDVGNIGAEPVKQLIQLEIQRRGEWIAAKLKDVSGGDDHQQRDGRDMQKYYISEVVFQADKKIDNGNDQNKNGGCNHIQILIWWKVTDKESIHDIQKIASVPTNARFALSSLQNINFLKGTVIAIIENMGQEKNWLFISDQNRPVDSENL